MIPSGVNVSPRLSIGISRLDFNFQNEIDGWHIEGFSRATEIAWSLFGEKPLLEINLGPSVIKDYATADSVNFYTPSFQKIDLQNISLFANVDTLNLNSLAKMDALQLAGTLNSESAQVSNVEIDAEKFIAKNGSSTFSANLLKGDLSKLNFKAPLDDQSFSSTLAIEDIIVSEPNLTAPEVMIELSVDEGSRNFNIDLHSVRLSEFGGSIESLKVDGHFNQYNVLQEFSIPKNEPHWKAFRTPIRPP